MMNFVVVFYYAKWYYFPLSDSDIKFALKISLFKNKDESNTQESSYYYLA